MGTKRIYFQGLNEVRAIAALFVVIHHLELYKKSSQLPSLFDYPMFRHFIENLGKNGVYIFFILSGFLITYLLLAEKEKKQKIDLPKFYVRRILRIWPLYYLTIFTSFALIPLLTVLFPAMQAESFAYSRTAHLMSDPYTALILFLIFLPNIALYLSKTSIGAAQAWSVGVEEQFYLIWPQFVQRFSKLFLAIVFLGVAFIYPYAHRIAVYISIDLATFLRDLSIILPINFMAIGGLGAFVWYYYRDKANLILKSPISPYLFIINTILFIFLLFVHISTVLLVLVVMVELIFIIQEHYWFNLRNKYLDWIGKVSYGLYMYHPTVMYIMYSIVHGFLDLDSLSPIYIPLVYLLVISFSLLISHLSYKYIESWFIRLKNKKYTVIKSGLDSNSVDS
ncbi:MAG: acyltransferase [Saprospiraceae bacterium]|nr:acyltransferase [Saprospiraceae bacterium]